jgi:hypothetical protein
MGAIYSAAKLTIIACAGDSPAYGLPGVTVERPPAGIFEHVGAYTVTLEPDTDLNDIYHSAWMSRSWTYQEGYLSKRRLFFTDVQAVYVCESAIEHEIHVGGSGLSRGQPGLLAGSLPTFTVQTTHQAVNKILEEYSFRSLSFETDALDAIVGALNTLEDEEPSIRHLYGVPFSRSPMHPCRVYFALHWVHRSRCRRRYEFPSWSPHGWEGQISFTDATWSVVPMRRLDSIEANEGGNQRHSLASLLDMDKETFRYTLPRISQLLSITTLVLDFEIKYIRWDTTDVNIRDGFHLIPPWSTEHKACIHPLWDVDTFDFALHSTLLCAHIVDEDDEDDNVSPIFLALDRKDDYFTRIGSFLLNGNIVSPSTESTCPDSEGEIWDISSGCFKDARQTPLWLSYATRRSFLLG